MATLQYSRCLTPLLIPGSNSVEEFCTVCGLQRVCRTKIAPRGFGAAVGGRGHLAAGEPSGYRILLTAMLRAAL